MNAHEALTFTLECALANTLKDITAAVHAGSTYVEVKVPERRVREHVAAELRTLGYYVNHGDAGSLLVDWGVK